MTPPDQSDATWQRFEAARARAMGRKRFRGDIIDNCKRFQFIGSGYKAMPAAQNGYFKIESARQVAGPLKALLDEAVRVVHVIGATQVLKSLIGDAWVIYALEHILWPMLVLFEDQDKAELYTRQRFMDTIHNHPELKKFLKEIVDENRHDVTGTRIKGGGAELLVAGLNDGNVSSLAWPLIWISEAWQHHKDGLLEKAFKRADRFPDTCKILNESQASLVGEDLHGKVSKAVPVPLVWRCPACVGEQTWEYNHWSHIRPEDFKPRDRLKISTISIGGETAIVTDSPKPGTYAGMKWKPDENLSIDEKAKSAYWECIWCGHHIEDTPPIRKAICDTYTQDYPMAKELWFTLPFESAWDNRFEKTVGNFLVAKAAKKSSNPLKMRDWFMAERALFYDPQEETRTVAISSGTYDPSKTKELFGDNFHSVNMAVDCQEDADHKAKTDKSITGWFWFVVRAYDKFGNSKQLARGYCKSWEAWRSVQTFWGVPNDRVMIDIVQWSEQVMNKAVEFRQMVKRPRPHPIFKTTENIVTWKLLAASPGRQNFKGYRDGIIRPWSPESSVYGSLIDESGKVRRIPLTRILFNKTPVQQQVDSLYSGAPGLPKFEFLAKDQLKIPSEDGQTLVPDTLTISMETNQKDGKPSMLSYANQMSAQIYNQEKNKYDELRPDDHYYWCEQALLVRAGQDGLLGQSAVFQAAE